MGLTLALIRKPWTKAAAIPTKAIPKTATSKTAQSPYEGRGKLANLSA